MPTYTIFAGVNGCGKTSIYKSLYYEDNKHEKRINTDEMVARIGSWKDNTLQIGYVSHLRDKYDIKTTTH
jgi:predicted ABC-type ATPase